MNVKHRTISGAMSLLLVFAVAQVYLAAVTTGAAIPAPQQQITGILSTTGNKPISVNNASAVTGATIAGGALIETPDHIGATITVPGHATLRMSPNSRLTFEIDPSGNVVVTVVKGCAVLNTNKGTSARVTNVQGAVSNADPAADNMIDSCAGGSGAGGAAAGAVGAGAGASGLFGLGTAATVAVVGGAAGAATAIVLANRGSNPSSDSP